MNDMQMENVVGNRHKLHPCIKHERYRGSSQIKFSDGDPDSSRPWKTTNQVQHLLHIVPPGRQICSGTQRCKSTSGCRCCGHDSLNQCRHYRLTDQHGAHLAIHQHSHEHVQTKSLDAYACRCFQSVLRCGTLWGWLIVGSAAQLPKICIRSRASMVLRPWHSVLVILTAAAQLTALQNDISSVLSAVAAAMAALEGFRLATFLKAVQLYCSVGVCWYGTATSPRMICQLK